MKNWNVCAMYFSATGTTERIVTYIAEQIAQKLGCHMDTYDFTLPKVRDVVKAFGPEDVAIFGVPVYAGRVPNVLLKYLDTVQGNDALAVPVVLYGNRNYDDGLIELRNILEQDGFHTIAGAAFIGEHSFSKILAAGRPDDQDRVIAKAFAEQVAEKLLTGTYSTQSPIAVKGQTPIRNYYQPRDRQGNPVDIRKVKPKTNGDCIDCKLCAEVCPMGSIDYDNVYEFKGICIKCGSCIKKCPMEAKYYDDEGYLYHQHELELEYERRAVPETFV